MKNFIEKNWLYIFVGSLFFIFIFTNIVARCTQKQVETKVETIIDKEAVKSAIDSTVKANIKLKILALDSSERYWKSKYRNSQIANSNLNTDLLNALAAYQTDTNSQSEKCNKALAIYSVKVDTLESEANYLSQALFDCDQRAENALQIVSNDSITIARKDEAIIEMYKKTKRTWVERNGTSLGFGIGVLFTGGIAYLLK